MLILLTVLIGLVAGLRAFTAPAVVAWGLKLGVTWGPKLGILSVAGTPLAFMGYRWTAWIFTALAIFELINDQNPKTPSRKVPPQFIARILFGGLSGATLGASQGELYLGLIAGVIGAVLGTLGGAWVRGKLAAAFGKDLPAGLLEDAIAIGLAYIIVFVA